MWFTVQNLYEIVSSFTQALPKEIVYIEVLHGSRGTLNDTEDYLRTSDYTFYQMRIYT